jgi:uncharacterized protein (TIGR02217 family)
MSTIPVLASVIAPNSLWSATVQGKSMRRNKRARNQGGYMQVNVGWTNTLRQYEFGTVPLSVSNWRTLEGLYEVTDAGAYGFLVLDPKDSVVPEAVGRATLYDASDPMYQLTKRYTAAGSVQTRDRTITRPKVGGFVLYVNGVIEPTYTLDETTGRVIIPSAPDAADVSWSGLHYVPVHFESDEIDWTLVIAGDAESRMMIGPNVVLTEVRE